MKTIDLEISLNKFLDNFEFTHEERRDIFDWLSEVRIDEKSLKLYIAVYEDLEEVERALDYIVDYGKELFDEIFSTYNDLDDIEAWAEVLSSYGELNYLLGEVTDIDDLDELVKIHEEDEGLLRAMVDDHTIDEVISLWGDGYVSTCKSYAEFGEKQANQFKNIDDILTPFIDFEGFGEWISSDYVVYVGDNNLIYFFHR